jgi:hypothetical protein
MIGNRIGYLAAPSVLVAAIGACVLAGCSGPPPPAARAAVVSILGAGPQTGGTAVCSLGIGMSWIDIGTGDTNPISNGSSQSGAPVSVTCTVKQTAPHTYSVNTFAEVGGQGSITMSGSMNDNLMAVQPSINAIWEKGNTGEFTEKDCMFDYGNQPQDLAQTLLCATSGNPPLCIAPGRIWGNLVCPMAFDNEHNNTCLAQAELRFENCGN